MNAPRPQLSLNQIKQLVEKALLTKNSEDVQEAIDCILWKKSRQFLSSKNDIILENYLTQLEEVKQ